MPIKRDELASTDFSDIATGGRLDHVTPGNILLSEFMEPMGLSARAVARDLDVPANRITEIINGERAITADTALRLERRFGASAEFWTNLQSTHDLELARKQVTVVA
jgi:antitoxin HigA-1